MHQERVILVLVSEPSKVIGVGGYSKFSDFKSNYVLRQWINIYKPKFRHQALKILDEDNIDSFHTCGLCVSTGTFW